MSTNLPPVSEHGLFVDLSRDVQQYVTASRVFRRHRRGDGSWGSWIEVIKDTICEPKIKGKTADLVVFDELEEISNVQKPYIEPVSGYKQWAESKRDLFLDDQQRQEEEKQRQQRIKDRQASNPNWGAFQ